MKAAERQKALLSRDVQYFTGRACKNGHTSYRWTRSGTCVKCVHSGEMRAKKRRYDAHRYALNPNETRRRSAEWYCNNRDRSLKRIRQWQKDNWAAVLRGKRFYCAQRRKHIAEQTPPWADLDAIKSFYQLCLAGMHVDHIVPLRGRGIRGLHVRENLQYLTRAENYRKHNHVEIDRH